jgi:iron complex transport system substrate-binding protein
MAAARSSEQMPNRPGWRGLRALDAGRRYAFAPAQYELLVRPGPRLGEAAELMADCVAALPVPGP